MKLAASMEQVQEDKTGLEIQVVELKAEKSALEIQGRNFCQGLPGARTLKANGIFKEVKLKRKGEEFPYEESFSYVLVCAASSDGHMMSVRV